MQQFSKLQRMIASFTITVAVFAFAVPQALAANSVISNPTAAPDPFHIIIPGHDDAAKIFFSYSFNAGGYASADLNEYIEDSNGTMVYYYGATSGADVFNVASPGNSETISREWNGKGNIGTYDGQYVPDGDYSFVVESHVPTPPDSSNHVTFTLERTTAPEVDLLSPAPSVYYTGSGDYTLNYSLALNSASTSVVRMTIEGPLNNSPQSDVGAEIKNADGNYTMSWDGSLAPAGTYTYTLNAEGSVDGFGVNSNSMTGFFTVSNDPAPSPTFSDLTADPSPYDPASGDITFDYKLNGSTGNTSVTASVYQSSNMSNAIKTWNFTSQSTGTNSVVWDGMDGSNQVDNGAYVFKLTGADGSFTMVPLQVSFTVATGTTPPSGQQCAGYTDVDNNDADCDAITYMQSIGAMTGNPDGTFAPDAFLQRDQIAKIVLETFNKFNSSSNYCGGQDPFPDVGSSAWSYQYICRGVDLGMITGYLAGSDAGYYRPGRSVNRVEFLALVLRNLSETMPSDQTASYTDVALGQWFSGYAAYSKAQQLFTGSQLYPTNYTSRREVAQVIYKLYQNGKI